MLDFVFVISFVHGVLYLVHTNMVHAAERSDSGGVIVLHVVCHWICRWISHFQSQGEADSDSMALESKGKFGWPSLVCHHQDYLITRKAPHLWQIPPRMTRQTPNRPLDPPRPLASARCACAQWPLSRSLGPRLRRDRKGVRS